MDDRTMARLLPGWVEAGWGLTARAVTPTEAGMNSHTAVVELAEGRFVAKWVPGPSVAAMDAGSAIAARLAEVGLHTGPPLPTTLGRLSHPTSGGAVALLSYVPGSALTGSDHAEQRVMAVTLARVHAVEQHVRPALFMPELVDLVHDVEPWIRPFVDRVLAEHARLPPLNWGILHTDPSPEVFRHDRARGGEIGEIGGIGMIDWSGATEGPVLYDVASAVMYLGGLSRASAFLSAYRAAAPFSVPELTQHLDAFRRLRAAVQAAYFSMRVATDDLTGIADRTGNAEGLRDARLQMEEFDASVQW